MSAYVDVPDDPWPEAAEVARRHAVTEYPRESCGVVLSDGTYLPCRNAARDPEQEFAVDDPEVDRMWRAGLVAAVVHSHPDGPPHPTARDIEQQYLVGTTYGVIPVRDGAAQRIVWWGDSLPVAPLLRRRFVWGVYWCYSLYRDWWRMRGWTPPNFGYDPDFVDRGQSPFMESCERCGLENLGRLSRGDLLPGDMLVARLLGTSVPSHCAVFVQGDTMLHHMPRGLSREDSVAHHWHRVEAVFRRRESA